LIQKTTILKKGKEQLAESLSYKNRFLDKEEWIKVKTEDGNDFEISSGGIKVVLPFISSENQKSNLKNLQNVIDEGETSVATQVRYFLLMLLAYLIIMLLFCIFYKPPFLFLITTITVSILCLHVGLFTPMLEIAAVEHDLNLAEIPIEKKVFGYGVDVTIQKKFEGDIYFYYQSKSIVNLILLLFKQNNYFVGICILLFSVLFPLIKTCLMCFFVFQPSVKQKKWFSGFVLNLSKWSMADVFVVAMFLGFLAFENMQAGVNTYSNVCMGLYFFLAYCLLSIISSMMAKMPSEEILLTDNGKTYH
jgi:hypothetical protein